MLFPNAEVMVHPLLLLLLGLIVGTLGGFFGVGGGFLITGGLIVFGVPESYAVGTGLTLIMGSSIINMLKHRGLGNVDFKLGILLVAGSIPAVYLAERLNNALETAGLAGPVIRYVYVIVLLSLAAFLIYDYFQTRRRPPATTPGAAATTGSSGETVSTAAGNAATTGSGAAADSGGETVSTAAGNAATTGSGGETVSTAALARRVQSLRIPPHSIPLPGRPPLSTYVTLPTAGIARISVFIPLLVGFAIGFFAGLLGAGGGFILMPVLVYALGIPTTVAIGTDLFQVIITGSAGTFNYACGSAAILGQDCLNRVDLLMALIILAAASAGSQIGATATRYVDPARIRILYGITVLSGAVAIALGQIAATLPSLAFLELVDNWILLGIPGLMCLVITGLLLRAARRGRQRA